MMSVELRFLFPGSGSLIQFPGT